jgi:recombination protein RecT
MENKPAGTPAPATTAVAKRVHSPVESLKVMVNSEKFKAELLACLPRHMTPDRQARILCTIINKNPKLADCDQASLINCMLDCSAMGLEPDGRRAHLIPFGRTCTLIVDYKGMLELIYRSEKVDFIDTFPVYANELNYDESIGRARFEIEFGGDPKVFHKPIIVGAKGEFVGAYTIAHIKGISKPKCVWMDKDDIDAIRKRSRSGNNGPWVTDYVEMAKKTTIRRMAKTLPLSYEINELLDREVNHEFGAGGLETSLKPMRPVPLRGESVREIVDALPQVESPPVEVVAETKVVPLQQTPPPEPPDEPEDDVPFENTAATAEQATATPTPAPEPPKPAAAPKPNALAGALESVAKLQQLCVENGIPELQLCKWAAKTYRINECQAISQIAEFAPKRVGQIVEAFAQYLAAIKATV